ncbi:MAG: exodeoxyribonuclease VII large subunit [Gammaproteobacteria bacterium]|nr:exodeoxyribonuclease VII large subunit [Gammaproteobacteria bacterium]
MTTLYDTDPSDRREIYSVSDINLQLKQLLAQEYPMIWVEGEISNLATPASGHIYFSLKDRGAQIRCVMFRNSRQRVRFEIKNGLHVVIRAKVGLYEQRGDLQLIADDMEDAGAGALQRQFEELKKKLQQEGLFAPERKIALPEFPNEIAIVTSATGAALHDFLNVIQRRFPRVRKRLYATPVQGAAAVPTLHKALRQIQSDNSADVIAIIRGGGSIEDLWAFNDESLARLITEQSIPVITGIGHEIDFTICDFVADVRAPTPSAAAEIISPDGLALHQFFQGQIQRLKSIASNHLESLNQRSDWLSRRLHSSHPQYRLNIQQEALKRLQQRISLASKHYLAHKQTVVDRFNDRLYVNSPEKRLDANKLQLKQQLARLRLASSQLKAAKQHRFQLATQGLNSVSPLATLERGYSITQLEGTTGNYIRSHQEVTKGVLISTRLADGHIISRVESHQAKKLTKSEQE